MIHKIEIINAKDSPFPYIDSSRNPDFNLGISYGFTKGVNIIVGANGSGKSTLLDIIKTYTLCNKYYQSRFTNALHTNKIFSHEARLLSGINVQSNYGCSTFNLREIEDNKDSFNSSDYNIKDFVEYVGSTTLSKGNQNLLTIDNLFRHMFNPDDPSSLLFPIKEIKNKINNLSSDSPWHSALNSLLNYYMDNNIPDSVVSVLMDEPEQNLDLYNSIKLYDILSHHREDTQIITSLHNPLLIYKLSKLTHINFIELTPSYINDIISFVEGFSLEHEVGSTTNQSSDDEDDGNPTLIKRSYNRDA